MTGTNVNKRHLTGPDREKIMEQTDKLGPLATAALRRPEGYWGLSGAEQWDIDKRLGILDWSGDPNE